MPRQVCNALSIASLLLIALATPAARAQDRLLGTWKMDAAASTLAPSLSPPQQQTESYTLTASGDIDFQLDRTYAKAAPVHMHLTWPAVGGAVLDPQNALPGITAVETCLGSGDWLVTFMSKGRQIMTMHKLVSADGKTMREIIHGLDPQGRMVDEIQVMRRQ